MLLGVGLPVWALYLDGGSEILALEDMFEGGLLHTTEEVSRMFPGQGSRVPAWQQPSDPCSHKEGEASKCK